MPMNVTFAKNQVITAEDSSTNSIYTDPVALGENDRGSAMLRVYYLYPSGTVTVTAQISNDGVNWAASALTLNTTAASANPTQKTEELNGAYVRFQM